MAIGGLFATAATYMSDAFSFAGAVAIETGGKITELQSLSNFLGSNYKEILLAIAAASALGIAIKRTNSMKEQEEGEQDVDAGNTDYSES